jgi:hypothetical protein
VHRVRTRFDPGELLQGAGCGIEMRRPANAADARRDYKRILRLTPDQDLFEAAVERPDAARVDDDPVLQIKLEFEIAFNAIDKNPKKHASQTLLDSIEESLVAIRNIQERVSETERLLENSKDKVAKQLEAQEKEEAEAAAKASAKAAGKGKKVKKVKVRGTAAIKTVEDESDEKPVKKVKKLLKPLKSLKKAIKTEGGKDAAASPAKSEKSKKKLSSALTGSLD